VVILIRGLGEPPPNSAFDAAVKDYLSSQQGFASAAGLDSLPELADAIATEFGYPWVWDFSSLGLRLAGARIEHLPDGKVLAYSLYKGPRGSVLCINFPELAYRLPPGGEMLHGVLFYKYKDLSIGVVRYSTVYCLIVSRFLPAELTPALTVGAPKSGTVLTFRFAIPPRNDAFWYPLPRSVVGEGGGSCARVRRHINCDASLTCSSRVAGCKTGEHRRPSL
jgi:hypothetical protein